MKAAASEHSSYEAAADSLRERARCCPTDPVAARAHHTAVKADAATGAPTTAQGRHLLATLRPWPGLGSIGECGCGSSLLILDDQADEA